MFKYQMLKVVFLSEMLSCLHLDEHARDAVMDYGFNDVSFGDASYTLIPGWAAVDRIVNGLMTYYDELEEEESTPSRNIPKRIWTEREIRARLGFDMEDGDYVDLEG